jgi:L-fuconolactonase
VIDSHAHIWKREAGYAWLDDAPEVLRRTFSFAELADEAGPAGVFQFVLVQADDAPGDTDRMLRIARNDERVAAVVGWLPLDQPRQFGRSAEARAEEPAFRGIRALTHTYSRPDWICSREVIDSLREVSLRAWSLDYAAAEASHLDAVLKVVSAVPEIRLILDHLGGAVSIPRATWRDRIARLSEHPTSFVKISGIPVTVSTDPWRDRVDTVLELFGPERVMLGSDWPVCLVPHSATYSHVATGLKNLLGHLSTHEAKAVTHSAARTAYRIPA